MTVTGPSVTEAQICQAVGDFLTSILGPNVDVLQGQMNQVAEPTNPDFVVMTHMGRNRLATNVSSWVGPASVALATFHATSSQMQIDVHGPNSTDNCQLITTLWRDEYACNAINRSILTPLDATDGKQMPFVNGEGQYEDRWVVTLTLQSNPVISTDMQFADILSPVTTPLGS